MAEFHVFLSGFIRPGRPTEKSYIESFNCRQRDECLNVEVFFTVVDVRENRTTRPENSACGWVCFCGQVKAAGSLLMIGGN